MVTLIENIHLEKRYRLETLYLAVSICDRYLVNLQILGRPVPEFILVAVVAILIAAKIEQPSMPSFHKMIKLVNESWSARIKYDDLVDLEADIIKTLDFSLQSASPILFLERYLRIFNYDRAKKDDAALMISVLAYSFCKVALRSQFYLSMKPSQVAAAAITLAVNLSTCPIIN